MNHDEPHRHMLAEPPILNTPASLKIPPKPKSDKQPQHKSGFFQTKAKKDLSESPQKLLERHGSSNPQLSNIVGEICRFNTDALESFNLSYVDLEQRLTDSLDTLQGQLERMQAMRNTAKELTEEYEARIVQAQRGFDTDLLELRQWQAPREKLAAMQERVLQLKEILALSKEKLANIDAELAQAEEKARKEREMTKANLTKTHVVLSILILVLALYFFFR